MSNRTKTTAILLSVFFGIFSWLYTYTINKARFWICLIFYFVVLINVLMIDLPGVIWVLYIYSFGVWLWARINNAVKPEEFFANYPK